VELPIVIKYVVIRGRPLSTLRSLGGGELDGSVPVLVFSL